MTLCQIIDLSFTLLLICSFTFLPIRSFAAEDPLKSADYFYKTRHYNKAEEIYRGVFINNRRGPFSERALWGMVRTDYKLKRYSEARLNLQRFLLAFPQSEYVDEAFLLTGYILMYDKKFDQAQHYFEQVVAPLKQKADIGRAEVALKRDDVAAAESIINAMDKKELGRNPRALYVQAVILSKKGMHKEAVSVINKIFDVILREEDLRADKALIYFNASRMDRAEKLCESIIADPVSMIEKQKAQKILAKVYEGKGRVDDALKLYLDLGPYETDDSVKMSIASLYDKKGDRENALRYASLLKDKGKRSSEIEKRLRQLIAAKDPKAAECLLKFLASISQESPFILTAAQYLIENGKKLEGNLLLNKAMHGVQEGDAALLMAQMLFKDGKYSEAEKTLAPLLLDNRYFVKATFLMIDILSQKGDLQGAIGYLEKANKYSKSARISNKIADLYLETGDKARALQYYKVASDVYGDAVAALKAGDLLFLSGNLSKSRVYYKRALSLGLPDEKSRQWAYYQYGKMTNDKEYLKKAANGGGAVGEAAKLLIKGE